MTRRGRGRPPHPEILTPAEQRVLNELRKGGTNAEIAERLGVTLDAVKYHISNMLGKLELDNREQLAAWRLERRRVLGLLAIPGTLESLGRPLLWAGAALGGAAAVGRCADRPLHLERRRTAAPVRVGRPGRADQCGPIASLRRAGVGRADLLGFRTGT